MAQTFNGKPGDLIEISHGPYQHWAVYIGENEVIHLVNECVQSSGWFTRPSSSSSSSSGSLGKVKLEKFTDVVRNHGYQVNNLLDKKYKALDPTIIVKAALAKVGPKQYDVATYNCEHFATEMRYGKAESRQVIKAAVISGATVGAGAGALVAGAPVVAVGATGTAVAAGAYALCKVPCSSRSSS